MNIRTNRRLSRIASSALAATVLLAAACSTDTPTSPASPRTPNRESSSYKTVKVPIGGVLKLLFPMDALTRDVALSDSITRSFTFDRKGGRIEIKETGLRVDVPAGAIPGNTLTITVTALPGSDIAYDFQPHGTVFLKTLKFEQDLKNTSWDGPKFKGTVLGGYFEKQEQLRALNGLSLLDELFPVVVDGKRASFDIEHFSGYMVSGGRQQSYHEEMF